MLNVILFSLIGGLASVLAVSFLYREKNRATKLVTYATPFAAGVLLAAALTDLIPEALHEADVAPVMKAVLLGMLAFFLLERYIRWFHHHHEHEAKDSANNSLIIVGDTLHNAIDGIAIGAAFLISPSTGIIASVAVAAHEIPQEIGDFGLLLKNGMKYKKVLKINIMSSLATTITAVATYTVGDAESSLIPYLLAVTAGFFIYIAASDIIPEVHESSHGKKDVRPWLLIVGAVLVMIFSPIAHDYIDASHIDQHDNSSETSVNHDDEELHIDEEEHHEDDDHHHE